MKLDFVSSELPWMPKTLVRTKVSCLDEVNREHQAIATWIWNTLLTKRSAPAKGDGVPAWSYPYSYRLRSGEVIFVGDTLSYLGTVNIPWLTHAAIHVGNGFYVSLVRKAEANCKKTKCGHKGPTKLAGQIRIDHLSRGFNRFKDWKRAHPGHEHTAGPMERVYRSLSSIGSYNYCPLFGNCQHFAKSCTARKPSNKVYTSKGFVDTTMIIGASALLAANLSIAVPMIRENALRAVANKQAEMEPKKKLKGKKK